MLLVPLSSWRSNINLWFISSVYNCIASPTNNRCAVQK